MGMTPKPFDPTQRLTNSRFLGKPALLTTVDLSRQFDLQSALNDAFSQSTGGKFDQARPLALTASYDEVGRLTWGLKATACRYTVRAARFDFDVDMSGTTTAGAFPALRVYLLAKRKEVTATTRPDLCTVASTLFPDPVPGANVTLFDSFSLAAAENTSLPNLSAGQEIVACLAAVLPESLETDKGFVQIPTLFYETSPATLADLPEANAPNLSVWQGLTALYRYSNRLRKEMLVYVKSVTSFVYVSGLLRTVGEMQFLQPNRYNAADYEADGRGKAYTPAWGWQLCDGSGSAPNYTGITLIGGTKETGSVYAYGATGGEEKHTLITPEMPTHVHDANFSISDGGADKPYVSARNSSPNADHSQITTKAAGDGLPHNNMPPFAAVVVRMWIGF